MATRMLPRTKSFRGDAETLQVGSPVDKGFPFG
jgi:hypothetical protein